MTDISHILLYSVPESSNLLDKALLAVAGYDVIPVSRANELEAWLKSNLRDTLLILSNSAPQDGLAFAAELRRTYSLLPIILVTSEVNQSILKLALAIGLVDCLTTPLDGNELIRSVENAHLRQKSQRAAKRYELILSNLLDGFILADLEGHILQVNPSARQIFNNKDNAITGSAINEVFYQQDFLDIFKPHRTYPYRNEISLDNGSVYSAQASLIPEIGIAVILQDITHLKQLDKAKTDFVNTISHDLRSPLTSIYGFIGLIDRVGPINRQQAEFIGHIQMSVQHITSLINDLLDLNRVEAGYDLQMTEVNLKNILTQTISGLEYQISEKMQEVNLTVAEDIPAILGNPLHLQRMVGNLIENAIKFSPAMGKVEIRLRSEAGQVILEVSDNGPGIPQADQPHIFEKFYRGSNLSQVTSGTGLGLSIVQSIVDKHHGRIWLDSSPQGTTFTVILPR